MAKAGAAKSRRGPGRPRGSRNKITNLAKQAIQMAFDQLGGVDALVAWVQKDDANAFAFYTRVYPKLLPRPALDAEPMEASAVQAVKGAFTWRTPDWARKLEKAQLRQGAARAALASRPHEGGRGGAPPDGGDEED
jgi:hypothetical protein